MTASGCSKRLFSACAISYESLTAALALPDIYGEFPYASCANHAQHGHPIEGRKQHLGLSMRTAVLEIVTLCFLQTLVVYVFSKTDTEYENNLMFFLRHGPAENDGCHYVFILQKSKGVKVHASTLPSFSGHLAD